MSKKKDKINKQRGWNDKWSRYSTGEYVKTKQQKEEKERFGRWW